MKKTISLLLVLVLCLSLCACGGEAETVPTENDELAFLTGETWKNVFTGTTSVKFESDGTGKHAQYDMTWEMYDNVLTYYYTYEGAYGSSNVTVECSVIEYNGVKMLLSDSTIYVSAANFKEGCAAAKDYMISVAEELNWAAAYDLYLSNAAKAEVEYDGKIVKWTATVYEISESYCRMANETYNGLPLNSINVYMDTDELIKLNKYREIAVIGIMNIGSFTSINCGFVVE